jgi:UDP-N-acetylglucosamine--N-acetylmuramyl-(pentapeptide) pyrophosphoryl-undecaprenol N-acetylglucosamine transferase
MRSDVCLSYAQTQTQLPRQAAVTVTGNPVRSSIARLAGERRTARLEEESPVLLVLGGSQGARRLNDLLLHLAASQRELLLGWRVRHQTGAADVMRVMAGYRDCGLDAEVQPFFDDMADVYRGAGLVVCRAGGTTLAELACAGLPAVLIPYPRAVADHQTHNARVFVRGGAAVLLPEGDVAPMAEALAGHVRRLRPETDAHHAMSHAMRSLAIPDAADTVASLVLARAAHVDPSFSTER